MVMRPEDVDAALVEIIAKRRYEVARLTDKHPENWPTWERLAQEEAALTVAFREAFLNGARGDLAAVLPDHRKQVIEEVAAAVERPDAAGTTSTQQRCGTTHTRTSDGESQ